MLKRVKKLKGFTLVELIIVMAIFSMIMFGALALIKPVSNQFQSTVRFENVRANLDNIRLYVEGKLRYADRVHVYTGYDALPTDIRNLVTDGPKDDSGNPLPISPAEYFSYMYWFEDRDVPNSTTGNIDTYSRSALDTSLQDIEIYLLEINNTDPNYPGRISLRTFNNAGSEISSEYKEFAVNQAYYQDYGFKVTMGNYEGTETINDSDGNPITYDKFSTFSPGDFAVTIEALEKEKDGTFKSTNFASTATFAMMNIWKPSTIKKDVFYCKVTDNTTGAISYNYDYSEGINPSQSALRYKSFHNPSAPAPGSGVTDDNNIYILFTLPKTISIT